MSRTYLKSKFRGIHKPILLQSFENVVIVKDYLKSLLMNKMAWNVTEINYLLQSVKPVNWLEIDTAGKH